MLGTHLVELSRILVDLPEVYPLTNPIISSGVGCSYYDDKERGNSGGISKIMNDNFIGPQLTLFKIRNMHL
jgi:hypothetical protein